MITVAGIFHALLTVLAIWILFWLAKRRFVDHEFLRKHGINGPKPGIFYGNLRQLKVNRVKVMNQWVTQYGKYFGFYLGAKPVIVISDVDTVRQVLTKESANFIDRPEGSTNEEPFKSSILYLKGEQWKAVRSVMTPAFSALKMRNMTDIMKECTNTFVDIIKKKAESGQTFDMDYVAQGLTLDVISRCCLAMDVDCQHTDVGLRKNTREFFKNAENAFVDMAHAFPILKHLLGLLYNMFAVGLIIKPILDNLKHVIELRRSGDVPKQTDMLQLMLDAQKSSDKMTDKHLMANSFLFMVAGYETSATAMAFISLVLADRPDVQEKIANEVRRHFPDKTELSYEDLHSLKYLDQVISECMRLYPPVILFVTRYCNRDTKINGYFFPAGAQVMIPVYQLHHDPELWDSPEEFRPERFAADAEREIKNGQYLPFGLGPRMCIGMRFAQLEIKMALVKLLNKVRLLPGEGFTAQPEIVVPTVIINPKNGIPVKAKLV